jgi:hypothetical protein
MRPYLQLLTEEDYQTACAFYVNKKYILSFPLRKEMIVYDRERASWSGPWRLPYGVSNMYRHIDEGGTERWVLGSFDSPHVFRFDVASINDDGEPITIRMRTKKTSFGDWTVLNIIQLFYILFRNVTGTVTVNILGEDRNGVVSSIKTFTIDGAAFVGNTGWGADPFGTVAWGDTNVNTFVKGGEELDRWGSLFKQVRRVQLEVLVNTPNSNFELLEAKMRATKMGEGSLSSASKV